MREPAGKQQAFERGTEQLTQVRACPVNGISMYYELHGSARGTPLLLLHGGGSSIGVTYGRILPYFAQQRLVIALDERAHGRSSDRDAPLRFDTSADDATALLAHLGVEQVDVMGSATAPASPCS